MEHCERPDHEALHAALAGTVEAALGCAIQPLRPLGESRNVLDDPVKALVTDERGAERAVVLCSAPRSPQLIARSTQRSAEAKRAMGPALGQAILDPLASGSWKGLSYVVLPYCRPLTGRWPMSSVQKLRLRRPVVRWLRQVTRVTAKPAATDQVDEQFAAPLRCAAELRELDAELRRAADDALRRIASGEWQPRCVLMHGDLWCGNILRSPSPTRGVPFTVIDWAGCRLGGYAFFDLVRLLQSIPRSRGAMTREIRRHCELLDCGSREASAYLAAALGYIGMNLEEFPFSSFVAMANACAASLRDAGVLHEHC